MTALAVDAPFKWVDNLLSQHALDEARSDAHGAGRRITYDALRRIALIRVLHAELGTSVARAVTLSAELLAQPQGKKGVVHLALDLASLRRDIDRRLAEALESAPTPRRGRPPVR